MKDGDRRSQQRRKVHRKVNEEKKCMSVERHSLRRKKAMIENDEDEDNDMTSQ